MILVSAYFLYLLFTALWAEYPEITVWYVMTDLIFIVIFALFYILSKNIELYRLIDFFVYLVPPACVIYSILLIMNPDALRIGGYVLVLLPTLTLFCSLRLIQSFSLINCLLMGACFLMLAAGLSRAPLLSAASGLLLVFVFVIRKGSVRFRFAATLAGIFIISATILIAITPIKINAARSFYRLTGFSLQIGDRFITIQGDDSVRWAVFQDAKALYRANWLRGIGYMNFMPWFGNTNNFWYQDTKGNEVVGMSLHNIFQTWGLEGGLPCLFIVAALLLKYFRILWRRIRESRTELEKSSYKAFAIEMICLLIFGLFHQIHQQPVLFMMLGIVFAFDVRGQVRAGNPHKGNHVRYLRKAAIS